MSPCLRLPRPGRGGKSHVLSSLPPLCSLFALFSALPSFVFTRLRPLLQKHTVGGAFRPPSNLGHPSANLCICPWHPTRLPSNLEHPNSNCCICPWNLEHPTS